MYILVEFLSWQFWSHDGCHVYFGRLISRCFGDQSLEISRDKCRKRNAREMSDPRKRRQYPASRSRPGSGGGGGNQGEHNNSSRNSQSQYHKGRMNSHKVCIVTYGYISKVSLFYWDVFTWLSTTKMTLTSLLWSKVAKGPRLGGNIFRGALAPSHGVCYVVQTQMSSHWLILGAMQLMHRCTCYGRRAGLVRTVTMNIGMSCLCVLYFIHHGSGLAPL